MVSTAGDTDLAAIGAILSEPARARVLLALADGRALPASMLAMEAGVANSTASEHLHRLVETGLITVARHGRYRYYELAGPEVGELIEAIARVAPPRPVSSLREGTRAHAIRRARHCYNHLAGRLGVALTSVFRQREWLTRHDEQGDVDHRGTPTSGALEPIAETLTADGADALRALGANPPENRAVRCCVDWTEQRHHMAGSVGRLLLEQLHQRGWIRPGRYSRALVLTDSGREHLNEEFNINPETYDLTPPHTDTQ